MRRAAQQSPKGMSDQRTRRTPARRQPGDALHLSPHLLFPTGNGLPETPRPGAVFVQLGHFVPVKEPFRLG